MVGGFGFGHRERQFLTFNGHPLWQDGDGPFSHLLLVQDGGGLGSPAVGAHPQEVPGQVGEVGSFQHSPAESERVASQCQHRVMTDGAWGGVWGGRQREREGGGKEEAAAEIGS